MLNRFLILQDPVTAGLTAATDCQENIVASLILDLDEPVLTDRLIQRYFEETSPLSFAILLKNIHSFSPPRLNDIFLLFTHVAYASSTAGPLIAIQENYPGQTTEHVKSEIRKYFLSQGFPSLELIFVQATPDNSPAFVHISNGQTRTTADLLSLSEYYIRYLASEYRDNDLFVIFDKTSALADTVRSLENIDRRAAAEIPYLFNLIQLLMTTAKKSARQDRLDALRSGELNILKELFNINQKNDEMQYVLNFYHREYEVLPLWFKRLGHIVKVLTGHRSLKSLLNDNPDPNGQKKA